MKLSLLSAIVVAVGCVGCAMMPQESMDASIEKFSPYCEGLGYKRDSGSWRGCIQEQRNKASKTILD